MNPETTSTWKAAVGIFLVFLFGCISGGLSTSLYYRNEVLTLEHSPSEVADILENRFTHHLGLEPAQHQEIHRILVAYVKARRQLSATLQPQMQTLNQQMLGQVRSVLKPEQLDGFQENMAQLRRRLAKAAARPEEIGLTEPGGTNAAPADASATNAAPIQ
jgi:hypothetical protein